MSIIDGEITITSGGVSKTFAPQTMTIDYDSLATADSGRTDAGIMRIQWILSRTRKVNITLPPMLQSEAGAILDLVLGRIYTIEYRDAVTNAAMPPMDVYTSKGSATLYSGTIEGGIWTGCSFNAIEIGGET